MQFNSGQVPKLINLYLDNNKDNPFSDIGVFKVLITNTPKLRYIDLRGNYVTARDVIHPHANCGTGNLTCDIGGSIGRVAP